jgi:ABC-2 type transport system ATP-binding protein
MPHVLDEPTTGMDVEGRRSFWASIRKDAERGRTVLFATHYLEEADAYADRIILLRHGQKMGRQHRRVAGDLRRGRDLAIQQGHRASLSQVSCSRTERIGENASRHRP